MLDTMVSNGCCACYMTSSGGPAWLHRCRKWSVAAKDASSMKAVIHNPKCDGSLLPHLYFDLTSVETTMELDQVPNMVSHLSFCDHLTKYIMAYVTPVKMRKLLLSFYAKDTSWSLEHRPSSWATEGPTLKATSSESFAGLWAYGRLGFHLTMLKAMDK